MEEVLKGITANWRKKKGHGDVELGDGRQIPFTIDHVTNVDHTRPQQIRNNLAVSVVLKNGSVYSVTLLEPIASLEIPEPLSAPHPGRFLNPYNFVRNLPDDRPKDNIMGRVPPPPHDRYMGLTGKITCTITNVTPLFVSDAHATTEEDVLDDQGNPKRDSHGSPKKHRKFRFFTILNENGKKKYAIPASSLRGMLRGVYETITNSCYAVFDGERKFEFREEPGFGNKVKSHAVIVRRLATKDELGQVEICKTAKVGAYYSGEKVVNNASNSREGDIQKTWSSGEYVIARAWQTKNERLIIREFAESKDKLQPQGEGEHYIEGWLKITGHGEGTQKLSETLFLDPEKNGKGEILTFNFEQQEEYNTILEGQKDRGQTPVPLRMKALAIGDLVWLEKSGTNVKRIVRVQIPRTPFPHGLKDFLPEHLHACQNYDELCPACRLFGWTRQNKQGENISDDKITAYAGRIRIGHAQIRKESGRYKDMSLAILASPKPTETRFYLLNKNGQPDRNATYLSKENATLRGRKFYWHHGSTTNSKEYTRAPFGKVGDKSITDDQNRTVRGALTPGSTFEFTLDFENLANKELAALLYALELEPEMCHRLGYAKPLGFGSIKIEVKRLELADVPRCWQSFDENLKRQEIPGETWQKDINSFFEAMKQLYGALYSTMLSELRTLLSAPNDSSLPIHYPRPEKEPNPEGRQFEWFVGNKKLEHSSKTLPLVVDETEGLPIINKDGVIVGD